MARPITRVERLAARYYALLAADPYGRRVLALRQTPGEAARAEARLALEYALARNADLAQARAAWLDAAARARAAARGALLVALPGQPALARPLVLDADDETIGAEVEAQIERVRRQRSQVAA